MLITQVVQAGMVAGDMEEAASIYSAYPSQPKITVTGALANHRSTGASGRQASPQPLIHQAQEEPNCSCWTHCELNVVDWQAFCRDDSSTTSALRSNRSFVSNALRRRRLGDRNSPSSRRIPVPSPATPYTGSQPSAKVGFSRVPLKLRDCFLLVCFQGSSHLLT